MVVSYLFEQILWGGCSSRELSKVLNTEWVCSVEVFYISNKSHSQLLLRNASFWMLKRANKTGFDVSRNGYSRLSKCDIFVELISPWL